MFYTTALCTLHRAINQVTVHIDNFGENRRGVKLQRLALFAGGDVLASGGATRPRSSFGVWRVFPHLCQELVFWLHPRLFFLFKNDKKINSDATNAASLSPTRSLPTFDVYNTQQTELSQYCARLISKIYPALYRKYIQLYESKSLKEDCNYEDTAGLNYGYTLRLKVFSESCVKLLLRHFFFRFEM